MYVCTIKWACIAHISHDIKAVPHILWFSYFISPPGKEEKREEKCYVCGLDSSPCCPSELCTTRFFEKKWARIIFSM